jgi:hypothetical protein
MKPIKKVRYYLRFTAAFFQKHKRLIIVSMIIGGALFFLYPRLGNIIPQQKIQIGLVGHYQHPNMPVEIQNLVSDGLTRLEPDGSVVPSLAQSWEVKNDNKEYYFKIRPDATWSNGDPIFAQDINYNFSDVTTIVYDNQTLAFQLKEAFSPFPVIVSRPIFRKGLIGTKDYQIKDLTQNGGVIESLTLSPQDSKNPVLVYRFYPSEKAARTAFALGEISLLKEITELIGPTLKLTVWLKKTDT